MTRIWRISADNGGFGREIREYPPNPRHPRSISSNLTSRGRNGLAAAFYN